MHLLVADAAVVETHRLSQLRLLGLGAVPLAAPTVRCLRALDSPPASQSDNWLDGQSRAETVDHSLLLSFEPNALVWQAAPEQLRN